MLSTCFVIICTLCAFCAAKPFESIVPSVISAESILSLFNPEILSTGFGDLAVPNFRPKRSVSAECEELALCRMHARAAHSFLATFQLYFVNKENARLWDHQQRTMADCDDKFQGCHGERTHTASV